MRNRIVVLVFLLTAVVFATAQMGPGRGRGPGMGGGMGMGMGRGGPMAGKWWKNPATVQQLGLSSAQVEQIESVFQQHRVQLANLRTALDNEEAKLEPLVNAEKPNESEVTVQIDKVATARANLEKSNALMLFGMRRMLTTAQWKQLQAQRGMGAMRGLRGPISPGGGTNQ